MQIRKVIPLVAAVMLLATGTNRAWADLVTVTVSGTYPDSIVGTDPMYANASFSLQFQVDRNPVPPETTPYEGSFTWPVTVDYSDNGSTWILTGEAGYYNYTDMQYAGLDVRVGPWAGYDMMQINFISPCSLFTGLASDPILSVTELDGVCCFNPNDMGGPDSFVADSSHYSATPEPVTLSLLVIGGLAMLRRRK